MDIISNVMDADSAVVVQSNTISRYSIYSFWTFWLCVVFLGKLPARILSTQNDRIVSQPQ